MILVLKSPCTIISPSLADPPTPHLLFSSLPSSFKSFSVPINPVINVTTLPPRFFLSTDAVAAAHADDELVQLGVINKIVLRLHIHDTLALALYHCFEFIQNRLVDRHNFVLLYQLILF